MEQKYVFGTYSRYKLEDKDIIVVSTKAEEEQILKKIT